MTLLDDLLPIIFVVSALWQICAILEAGRLERELRRNRKAIEREERAWRRRKALDTTLRNP